MLPEERHLALVLLADATSPVAIFLTGYLYFRSISVLRGLAIPIGQQPKEIIKSLYRYACVQILTMGPLALYFTVVDITNWSNEIVNYIMITPYGLTGFTNAVVYFFQRSKATQEGETNNIALSEFQKSLASSKELIASSKELSSSIISKPDLFRLSVM